MTQERCESCYAGAPILSDSERAEQMNALLDWQYDKERCCLVKCYEFKGYYKTIAFVNAIAWIAQQQQHHPDLQVSYNTVTVCFQTHAVGGVTHNDILCAKLVDGLG